MSQGSSVPFFIFLAVFLFFLLTNRGKKNKQPQKRPPAVRRPVPPKVPIVKNSPIQRNSYVAKRDTSYEVEKKKEIPLLQKTWKSKNSLKQAFILSEIVKRVDERDPF